MSNRELVRTIEQVEILLGGIPPEWMEPRVRERVERAQRVARRAHDLAKSPLLKDVRHSKGLKP